MRMRGVIEAAIVMLMFWAGSSTQVASVYHISDVGVLESRWVWPDLYSGLE